MDPKACPELAERARPLSRMGDARPRRAERKDIYLLTTFHAILMYGASESS